MAEPVRVRRLTDQEGQKLQQIVRRDVGSGARRDRGRYLMLDMPFSAPAGYRPAVGPRHPSVLGTVVALFLLAVGIAGFQQLGAPFWVSPVFNGTALLIAVGLAVRRGSGRAH